MISPFLDCSGGACQVAVILVEVSAVTVKLAGAFEGAVVDQISNKMYHKKNSIYGLLAYHL